MKWFICGEVFFTTTQRRNNASRRLDNFVANSGWQPEWWDALGNLDPAWTSGGQSNITGLDDGGASVPGLRFCYSTTDEAQAVGAHDDIVKNWSRYEDTNSWWSFVATAG